MFIVKNMDQDKKDNSSVVLNMENMIKSLMAAIDEKSEEADKYKSALNDILENDETYQEHSKLAKEASRVKSATRKQILKQPQAADLDSKVKTLTSEIKETKASLSDYLREFQRISGISEIEGKDGELREIVYTAKLVRKSSGFGG